MAQARNWPGFAEYRDAVQTPQVCFSNARLQGARVETDPLGIPQAATGKSAIVFRARAGSDDVAIRCFTRQATEQRTRYQELHKYLAQSPPSYLVNFTYHDDAILVLGKRYPIVEMVWAKGDPLHIWVGRNLADKRALSKLAANWLGITNDLRARQIAHGDLANDNCHVQNSEIKLIDYDGCYIPPLASSPPGEAGNQNFQHPAYMGYYAPNMDAFSALVVYLSLRAVEQDKSLWRFHTGDNLIFIAKDFQSPGTTPVWRSLARNSDSEVKALTATLADMCKASIETLPYLGEVVAGSTTVTAAQDQWWLTWQSSSSIGKVAQDSTQAHADQGASSWLEDQFRIAHPKGPSRQTVGASRPIRSSRASRPVRSPRSVNPRPVVESPQISKVYLSRGKRRKTIATWSVACSIVLVLALVWLAHERVAKPTARNLTLSQLRTGDCLRGANLQLNVTSGTWPNYASSVPCNEVHTAEVFYVYNWPKGSAFPGRASVISKGASLCDNAFRIYVGIPQTKSEYSWIDITSLTSAEWKYPPQSIVCVAYEHTKSDPAGVTLDQSIRGSRE